MPSKRIPAKVVLAASFENPDSQDRGAKAPQLVVPNDAFREAVNGDWGIVNLPMWWDNKVRSLFTAASASNIMGVPTLSDEEVVPSLPTVSTRLLGGTLPENPEHRPLRFRYSLPGTTRVVSLFEIFVLGVLEEELRRWEVFQGSHCSGWSDGRAAARLLSHAVGKAFRSGDQPARACRHAARKLAKTSWPRVHHCRPRFCGVGCIQLDLFPSRRRQVPGGCGGWRRVLLAPAFAQLCFGSSHTFCRRPLRC